MQIVSQEDLGTAKEKLAQSNGKLMSIIVNVYMERGGKSPLFSYQLMQSYLRKCIWEKKKKTDPRSSPPLLSISSRSSVLFNTVPGSGHQNCRRLGQAWEVKEVLKYPLSLPLSLQTSKQIGPNQRGAQTCPFIQRAKGEEQQGETLNCQWGSMNKIV